MSKTPKVDLATAEAERDAWVRIRDDLTARLAAANSELRHWDGVIEDLKKKASK